MKLAERVSSRSQKNLCRNTDGSIAIDLTFSGFGVLPFFHTADRKFNAAGMWIWSDIGGRI